MARAHALAAILLVLALAPGCVDGPTDGDAPDGDSGDGDEARTYEECDTIAVPYEANGTEWTAARVECDANVAGTDQQTLDCGDPEEASLRAATNLTTGAISVLVDDGEDEQVADHELQDTGGEARELDLAPGGPGTWTLQAERGEEFEGRFQVELACPQE